jgi:hypothetical protein
MLEPSVLHGDPRFANGLIENGMAYITICSNDLAAIADMLAIVATEAAKVIKMAYVIWMGSPVHLHLGEDVGLKDSLQFGDRAAH